MGLISCTFLVVMFLAAATSPVFGNDPDMLQDICVADSTSSTHFLSFSMCTLLVIFRRVESSGVSRPGLAWTGYKKNKIVCKTDVHCSNPQLSIRFNKGIFS